MSRSRVKVAVGLGVAAVVAVVGLGFVAVAMNPQQWTAQARLAVFPDESDAAARASFYETLSHGQIVSTVADVLRSQVDGVDGGPTPEVRVVSNTSIITITVTAERAIVAQDAANEGVGDALVHIDALGIPFTGVVVGTADTAERSGIPPWTMMAATTLAGIVVGLGLAQAVLAFGRPARRRVVTEVDDPPTPLRRVASDL